MSNKDSQRNRLLAVSERLFLKHGYRGVTMRMIASELDMSLGNAYNYFKSKEEIFEAILHPVLTTLEYIMERHNDEERVSIDIFYDGELTLIQEYTFFINNYRKELNLLMNYAQGSKYEDYKEYFIKRNLELSEEYLQRMHEKEPELRTTFSQHFIRYSVISWYEMIRYLIAEDLPAAELAKFMAEYHTYHSGGWKKLMYPAP